MTARRYEISLQMLRKYCLYIFQHEKRNFVSPSDHVMFCLLYKKPMKYQTIAKGAIY